MESNAGKPHPFGISFYDNRVNFSLYVKEALSVSLVLEHRSTKKKKIIPLDPQMHKSGKVWHIALPKDEVLDHNYSYLLDEKQKVLDPYAYYLNTGCEWKDGASASSIEGVVHQPEPFDWENVHSPGYSFNELIIYEMHVRSFTLKADVKHPGTFLGMIEKIPHLKSMGINAVELMPIHEFNEMEYSKEGLCNYWGYSPIAYFAFMQRYASKPLGALEEFKTLVRELHKEKIEILIDVVYNHTGEGGKEGPVYHFKALDPHYYILDESGHFVDYSGCGNTLDANHFPSMHLILESLRYMASECHVDGFRFDLASTFYRDAKGTLALSPIVQAMIEDPVLSQKKLIAEAWDARGLYQVGAFPSPFGEWNGAYRDKIRQFLKHDAHSKGGFADAVSGSHSLYHKKKPAHSINFITAHDGFTLHDLVSYNQKHNLANGEHNRDGNDSNYSYNWGHEGETKDPSILQTRKQVQKAALSILYLSLGTPMLLMGDEYGHTRKGNNNAWCHDNELNHFDWSLVNDETLEMLSQLTQLRKELPFLKGDHFFDKKNFSWHGLKFSEPGWGKEDGYLALYAHPDTYLIFNLSNEKKAVMLPDGVWHEVFNSTLSPNHSIEKVDGHHFLVDAHTVCVLSQKNLLQG